MIRKSLWCALASAFALTACSAQEINKGLGQLNQQLANTLATSMAIQNFATAVLSPAAAESFQKNLVPPAGNPQIAADWPGVQPVVERAVKLSACGTGNPRLWVIENQTEAYRSLGRYADPDSLSRDGYFLPLAIFKTTYHPRSTCLGILRVDQWAKPAKNALQMRVQFISHQSEEVVLVRYLFRQLDDNSWVVVSIQQ